MANSIKMDSLHLNRTGIQANTPVSYTKDSGFNISGGTGTGDNGAVDTILNISKGARLKLQNQVQGDGAVKKAGVTSTRELFEIAALDDRNFMRGIGGCGYPSGELLREWMRIDEPETYAKMKAIENTQATCDSQEEVRRTISKVNTVEYDWFCRRCLDDDGWLKNPVTGKRTVVSALEARYSDSVHDVSVDAYDDSFSEENGDIWRFNTKFSVLLPMEMLNDLEMLNNMDKLSEKEQDELREKIEKIDTAVGNMKQAEIDYEGSLLFLRFGVKFDHDGNVTYHANYTDCEDKNGISADSAEGLLEKLMSK